MTYGYDDATYHQRNKTETIFSVTKRMFGDCHIKKDSDRELTYRIIAYNCHRIIQNNLLVVVWFLHDPPMYELLFSDYE